MSEFPREPERPEPEDILLNNLKAALARLSAQEEVARQQDETFADMADRYDAENSVEDEAASSAEADWEERFQKIRLRAILDSQLEKHYYEEGSDEHEQDMRYDHDYLGDEDQDDTDEDGH